jgi:L-alanine-DL-glutamate epimerase-like enolase superfamily enzyme
MVSSIAAGVISNPPSPSHRDAEMRRRPVLVGWSEFDEGFGSPRVSAVVERLAGRVAGQSVFDHERIYTKLYCFIRPAAGGVVAEGLGAIENALLDAKAKALRVPCHALLGGKLRDRIRVWSHCATWRINHPTLYKPAITSLDGVKAMGVEVCDKGLTALNQHLHVRGWRCAAAAEAHEVNIAPHNFYGHLATMMNAHSAAPRPIYGSWKSTSIVCLGTRICSRCAALRRWAPYSAG